MNFPHDLGPYASFLVVVSGVLFALLDRSRKQVAKLDRELRRTWQTIHMASEVIKSKDRTIDELVDVLRHYAPAAAADVERQFSACRRANEELDRIRREA
ncbi:hypothetical protein [Coralloluteibacterium thermophilus]|uniref:Uncharacterized protein n=1 Tax=Coralloluteibacterium thermophilum TaxID=2707049 RepID=A0ABV9NPV0_9GAMM